LFRCGSQRARCPTLLLRFLLNFWLKSKPANSRRPGTASQMAWRSAQAKL